MAPLSSLIIRGVVLAADTTLPSSDAPAPSTRPYPAAIALATVSALVLVLMITPLTWHCRNRNFGATALCLWAMVVMLLQCFVNAVIWPNDDIASWYDGAGLCDVEVKLQAAFATALPSSLACVLRGLSNAMDTKRVSLGKTTAQKRKDFAFDFSLCILFPALQMVFHYIVQGERYYLLGIAGCEASFDDSWPTIVLLVIPPLLFTLLDAYYALLVLARLYHYRQGFASILACSNTTNTRFMRLYIFCLVLLLPVLPLEIYTLYQNLNHDQHPYSWAESHNPKVWNRIRLRTSNGSVYWDRWIWLACGVVIFLFFGLGRDAVKMYKDGLLAIGASRIFPSLREDWRPRASPAVNTISSFSSKAKIYFDNKRNSVSTWSRPSKSVPNSSRTDSIVDPLSPRTNAFMEPIRQDNSITPDLEENGQTTSKPSATSRLASALGISVRSRSDPLEDNLPNEKSVRSHTSTGGSASMPAGHGSSRNLNIIVKKEVRQGSETFESPPFGAEPDER
ncbi:STE3-domain-containing protein [Teratosphaeria nubilosa]|uniref:STE3-domain-containing protein n=1 Tax=Teratosphaeria nubilosa TaxID=161662 RepID=A0A6G1L7K5_9PEZI|nr:STE3-domain-containing protein [Teratosphaeria nubilosa]